MDLTRPRAKCRRKVHNGTGPALEVGDKVSLQLSKRFKPILYRVSSVTEADANGRMRTRTTKRRKPKSA